MTLHKENDSSRPRATRGETERQTEFIKNLVFKDSVVAIASADAEEEFDLLKVVSEGCEVLGIRTKDDYGLTFKAGTEVIRGNFFVRDNDGARGVHTYTLDDTKIGCLLWDCEVICTDLKQVDPPGSNKTLYYLPNEVTLDILESLCGFLVLGTCFSN